MTDRGRRRPQPDQVEQLTLDLDRGEMVVRTSQGEDIVVDVSDHREAVVRRLLYRGLSPGTLRTLLPDWDPLIERVSDTHSPTL